MTGRERVEAVLKGRPLDRMPVMHMSFSSRVASAILGREAHVGGGIQQYRESVALWNGPDAHAQYLERCRRDAIDIALAFGHDMVRPGYWRLRKKPSARIDELTFRYDNPDGSWEIRRLDPPTELYNVIDASSRAKPLALEDLGRAAEAEERAAEEHSPKESDFEDVRFALAEVGKTLAVRAAAPWTCIPPEEPAWLEATMLMPDLVARYLDAQLKVSLKNIPVVAGMGAKMLFGGGDFASNTGPMYSPKVFRELMLPRLRAVSDECHRLGAWHLFGSDGNVWAVAEDLYGRSGVDGHYEFDRRAGMSPPEVHAKYPRLAMFGNISSHTLHTGSVDDVVRETRECLDEARATGRVVTGCSNIIISETPMANVEAMMKTMEKYR